MDSWIILNAIIVLTGLQLARAFKNARLNVSADEFSMFLF